MYETEVRTQLVARDNVTFALELLVRHNDTPFDFTDYSVAMQWRRGSTLALNASSTGTDPAIVINGNLVSITVPVDLIKVIGPGRYEFDVIATSPDYTWQLGAGMIDLRKGVTQPSGGGQNG